LPSWDISLSSMVKSEVENALVAEVVRLVMVDGVFEALRNFLGDS
jgi:hypothetical protein